MGIALVCLDPDLLSEHPLLGAISAPLNFNIIIDDSYAFFNVFFAFCSISYD